MNKKAQFILECFEKTGQYDAHSKEMQELAWATLREAGYGFEVVDMDEVYDQFVYRFNDTDRNGYVISQGYAL
tara:strand:- start:189 stop:407 length:219 start_codon:yes stop_codon:yes gene_type:complete